MALRLRVVTPSRLVVDTEVTELTAPGSEGELGVLPMHVTFLGQLDVGILRYSEGGAAKQLVVHGGYAEVLDDVVTILADDAEFPDEVDVAGAKADLERIAGEIGAEQEDTARVAELLAAQKKAQVRLDLAGA
jgi:F-type H+-transporting ATPase subunit epsilon